MPAPQSSIVTGGITLSAATLAPVVSWAFAGFPQPVPEVVPYVVAAGVITLGHAIVNAIATRKNAAQEAGATPDAATTTAP